MSRNNIFDPMGVYRGYPVHQPFAPLSPLPAGYIELGYIRSTGTQYIRTAVNSSYVLGIDTRGTCYAGDNSYDRMYLGCQNSSTTTSFIGTLASPKWKETSGAVSSALPTVITVFDGVITQTNTAGQSASATFGVTFPAGYRMYLFGGPESRISPQASCYYLKLYGNEYGLPEYGLNLLFDGRPAMRASDGVVGLYDLVSDTFLTNFGSGTFEYGEKGEVES